MRDETQADEMGAPPTFGDRIEIATGPGRWDLAMVMGVFYEGASGYAETVRDVAGRYSRSEFNTWKHTFGVTWRWPSEGGRRSHVVTEDDARQLEALKWCEAQDALAVRRDGQEYKSEKWLVVAGEGEEAGDEATGPTIADAVEALRRRMGT